MNCPICSKLFIDQNAILQHAKFSHNRILPKPMKARSQSNEDAHYSSHAHRALSGSIRMDDRPTTDDRNG